MRNRLALLFVASSAAWMALAGCHGAPGKPGPEPEVPRPDQILDFATLYSQNCVACHGDSHQPGAAISLANPVFLAVIGESNIKGVLVHGVPGKLMPAFAQSGGGMLTDEQVDVLAKGLISNWGKPNLLDGQDPPPYEAALKGDVATGKSAFGGYCGRCHGADGEGNKEAHLGSIVDPSYLGLISDQELRNITIAGLPGMPDWRSDTPGHAISNQEITNIVAWVGSHREATTPPSSAPSPDVKTPDSKTRASATKVTHEPSSIR